MLIANILSEQWLHPDNYNFWSSEWGGIVVKLIGLILVGFLLRWIKRRFECDVEAPENCHKWGHSVHGTGHRACLDHHPHGESRGAITAEDILRHHEQSDPRPRRRP